MKRGRPSKYRPLLARRICESIESGLSLRQTCQLEGMPAASAVHRWLNDHPEFQEQYAKARQVLCEHWADEILDIADDGTNDWMNRPGDDGEEVRVIDHEHIARSRLRVDTRKWVLSKLSPKKWGDKQEIDVINSDGSIVAGFVAAMKRMNHGS